MDKICCFAGHNMVYGDDIKNKIKKTAEMLIKNENVKKFLVGNYGGFDGCSAAAIRELKKTYRDITLDLIIPYVTKSMNDYKEMYYENYDCIVMADIPASTPARYHIAGANRYMVDKSDFLICHINHSWGGAAETLRYAERKKHIKVFNLAEEN